MILKAVAETPVVSLASLRAEMPREYQGEAFDDAVLRLADDLKITVSKDADPSRFSEQEAATYVRDGEPPVHDHHGPELNMPPTELQNPFLVHQVDAADRLPAGDVPELHAGILARCEANIAQTRHAGQSLGLLIVGEAGSGKSHMIARLRRNLVHATPVPSSRRSPCTARSPAGSGGTSASASCRNCCARSRPRSRGRTASSASSTTVSRSGRPPRRAAGCSTG